MQVFQMSELETRREKSKKAYLEFLRVPSMSGGIYKLSKGATDAQKPHREDELYYVVEGRGMFRGGAEDRTVGPGSLLFVPAEEEHRFHSISEDLTVLVLFAPEES